MTDSLGGNYAPSTVATATTTTPIDLSGNGGCYVDFRIKVNTELDAANFANSDIWTLSASHQPDSGFVPIFTYAGTNVAYEQKRATLDSFDGDSTTYLRMQLAADGEASVGDGVRIDNVRISCGGTSAGGAYAFLSGTSMAAPHVTAAAALVRQLGPGLSPATVKERILDNLDATPAFTGNTVKGGRLNLQKALNSVDTTAPTAATLVAPVGGATVANGSPTLSWNAASDNMGIASYSLIIDSVVNRTGITGTSATPLAALGQGVHTWQVRAFDTSGNQADSTTETFNVPAPPPPPPPPPAGSDGPPPAGAGGDGSTPAPVSVPTSPNSPLPSAAGAGQVTIGSTGPNPSGRDGSVLKLTVDGPGSLTATATTTAGAKRQAMARTVATGSATAVMAGDVSLTLKPNASGKKLLKKKARVAVTVQVTFTPASGQATTATGRSALIRGRNPKKK